MSTTNISIAVCQLLLEGGEPDRNLDRARSMILRAGNENCQIALLPECMDLVWTHPSASTEAKPIPGRYSDYLCRTAAEAGIFVCAGLTEDDGDKIYNSAVLINPAGKIMLKYRKINVLEVGQKFYAIGNMLSVAETPHGVIGVNICSDNYADALDIGRTLGRMGAQLILSPSSWTVDHSVSEEDEPYGEKWIRPFHTLAKEFNLAIISATGVGYIVGGPYEGKKMVGCSLAVGPSGIISQAGFNEFSSEFSIVEIEIPQNLPLGTAIGNRLK